MKEKSARFYGDLDGNRMIVSREAVVFTGVAGESMTVSYKDPHREKRLPASLEAWTIHGSFRRKIF